MLPSGDAGVAGLVAALCAALAVAGLLPGTVMIIYVLKFTKACPGRVTHAEASAPATP